MTDKPKNKTAGEDGIGTSYGNSGTEKSDCPLCEDDNKAFALYWICGRPVPYHRMSDGRKRACGRAGEGAVHGASGRAGMGRETSSGSGLLICSA